MDELKRKFNVCKIWYYMLFLFAFICVGFTVNSSKVEAAEVSVLEGIDSSNKVHFKVTWSMATPDTIQYYFDSNSSSKTSIAVNSFVSGKAGDATYEVDVSSVEALKANGDYFSSKTRSFTLNVEVRTNVIFGIGGTYKGSGSFTYSVVSPGVDKVVVDSPNRIVKIGDTINFTIGLNQSSFVGNGVKVKFKIGGSDAEASCGTSYYGLTNSINCSYVVSEGVSGSISGVKVIGATSIKGAYDNAITTNEISVSNVTNEKNLSVDGIKPSIIEINASNGVFSSSNKITLEVVFSEKIGVVNEWSAPELKVKFGSKSNDQAVACVFSSAVETKLIYECVVGVDDQGNMSFVSILGGSGFVDGAGNPLNLTASEKEFSETKVDNNIPEMSISYNTTGCSLVGNVYYCKSGSKFDVTFTFNMRVSFNSRGVVFGFGGISGQGTYSAEYVDADKLRLVYVVGEKDDGKFSLNYAFDVRGINGIQTNISSVKEYDYYIDNKAPVLGELMAYYNEENVTNGTIFASLDKEMVFKLNVTDASSLTLDSSKIYLLDENDNKLNVCATCNVKSITSELVEGELVVKVITGSNYFKQNIKLKVEREAIKDYFNSALSNEFVSGLYTIDCELPAFEVEIDYPEYKGYNDGDSWVLISGNVISFKITSSNKDLKDFCIVSNVGETCLEYTDLELGKKYEHTFAQKGDGSYSFYVKVRDTALNETSKNANFILEDMFSYSNGLDVISRVHSITVDVSIFEDGTNFKYGWFKKGGPLSFANANVTSKQDDTITIDGENTYNGEYMVCINRVSDNVILCSEYVKFDNMIDSFEVNVFGDWTNGTVGTSLVFNDASTIKCIAIGKNYSTPDCNGNNENVIVYKTSQAISPLNKYIIEENGIYYFYIEDAIGNSNRDNIEVRTVTNIDNENIKIEIYNGNYGEEYNSNLELDSYKSVHNFLITFDKGTSVGSNHRTYKYFFSTSSYSITSVDSYNSYFLKNNGRLEITNPSSRNINISTPNKNGVYNLYVMAIDSAGNVSFASVSDIKVDVEGPSIKKYDVTNAETDSVGSDSYIVTFNYSFVIEDYESKLDLNKVYYNWIDSGNNKVFAQSKKYDGCPFDYNMCRINGDEIEFGKGLFDPTSSYKFELEIYDNAGNVSKFISSSFKIDTTSPVITTTIDSSKWYNVNSFSFTASKENNIGTLDEMAYCLNDCMSGSSYDFSKFNTLTVNNPTKDTKTITLNLNEGANNILYLYSRDVFGNSSYSEYVINYDKSLVDVKINNVVDGIINLSESSEKVIDINFKDEISGVTEYCIYLEGEDRNCYNGGNLYNFNKEYIVDSNGVYIIEVMDAASNTTVVSVNVIGIDTDAIAFDLSSNINEGKFTNNDVTISVINMRKFMVDNVADKVSKIDYVVLDYDSTIDSYESAFVENVVAIYNRAINDGIVTSFNVSENGLYIVRIIDTAGNVSYNYIRINMIDKVNPIIDTNKNASGTDKIYVSTITGNNIRVEVDGENTIYNYSNDSIKVYFEAGSLTDEYTEFNNYLGVKVCFDDSECVYNTYNVEFTINENKLKNKALNISAPYNFSGMIRYYLVDAAGNESLRYSFTVRYQSEVSDVQVVLKDLSGNEIIETSKYNKINVNFIGDEANDIINNNGIRYVLKEVNINMANEFANREGSIDKFLSDNGFVVATSLNVEVSLNNVDSNYYVWVFIRDLLNNYKLIRADELVKVDTIAPQFNEISLGVVMIDSSNYDLEIGNVIDEYTLFIDANNDGVYEEVTLTNNKYSFTVNGVSDIHLKLMDKAGNVTADSFSLSSIVAEPYVKVYQVNNELKADLVVYNLGNKNITSFSYIVTEMNSTENFDDNSINSIDNKCEEYSGTTCVSSRYSKVSDNVYRISLSADKKVVFYVYVDGNLVKDSNGNLLQTNIFVDSVAPLISFDGNNPSVISTKNGSYIFNLTIIDDNPSNNYKYILSSNTNVSVSSFETQYNNCVNSTSCARGNFESNIVLNSSSSVLSQLVSGNYYLYVYASDVYGNAKVNKSAVIVVDNDAPVISYSEKDALNMYQDYKVINSQVFASGAVKVKFSDTNLSYFEIYKNDSFSSKCFVNGTAGDQNCVKDGIGEIGFVKDGNFVYYYLDNGNYNISAYDSIGNVKEVMINIDNGTPVINLYKNINGTYEIQNSSKKVFNSLSDLYVSVVDNNFNYLTIDLENTNTGDIVSTVARYSYNSELGICLSNSTVCAYGKDLKSLLSNDTSSYNKIIITAYDKANRYSSLEIVYDDEKPIIWMMSANESIYIDGMLYVLDGTMNINVEIGVNKSLNLDKLLNKVILDIDGYTYEQIKNMETFKVTIYKEATVFTGDVFGAIGAYSFEINYRDEAGNIAETKMFNITVADNVEPTLEILDLNDVAEIKTETELNGVKVSDNYGIELDGEGHVVKEKILGLSDAVCSLFNNGVSTDCAGNINKISANVYKFMMGGTYTFVYSISDLSGNVSSITQTIYVSDNSGPVMSSSDLINRVIEIGNRNNDNSINVNSVSFSYPSSYDNGDENSKLVEYVGLFSINKMGEKYKIDDYYKQSDDGVTLTYKFNKVGEYYLRFRSSDKSNNVSVFEYHVEVVDKIAPVIRGLNNGLLIELGLEDKFSVEDTIINRYNVVAVDNYDTNVVVHYDVVSGNAYTYEVTLNATDASNNTSSIKVYVNIIDNIAPVVGELVVRDSTNLNNLEFKIVGGEDNSNNYWHEYSVLNGAWARYEDGSKLVFGNDLSREIQVCIRAVDVSKNVSEKTCKYILVDTKLPSISGVEDGEITNSSVTINVSDDRLASVKVLLNNEEMEIEANELPFKLSEIGSYSVIAEDTLGNKSVVNFMINLDVYVDVVNDLNSDEYTITSVEFDKQSLVKAEIVYDNNGDSNISVKLDGISVNENDMVYILGVLPNINSKFVMFSANGADLSNYSEGINLVSYGNSFKDGFNNEDCFLKFNDDYYAYVIVKKEVYTEPVIVEKEEEKKDNSGLIKTGLIVLGSLVTIMVGYQIIKLRRRVRAA